MSNAGVETAGAATDVCGAPNRPPLGAAAAEDAPARAPPKADAEEAPGVANRPPPLAPPNKLPADAAPGAAPNKPPPVLALEAAPNKLPPALLAAGAPNMPPAEAPAPCPAPKMLLADPKVLVTPPKGAGAADVEPEAPNKGCAPNAGAEPAAWPLKPNTG